MKNLFLVLCGIALLFGVMGFNLPDTKDFGQQNHNADKSSKKTETSKAENPLISNDLKLYGPGEAIQTRQGTVTLKKILHINKFYYLNGLEYTINDVQLLHFSPVGKNTDYFRHYTDKKEFDFIKINIELVNSNPHSITFSPIQTLSVNDYSYTERDDFYQKGLSGKLAGGETKSGNIGFILKEENAATLTIQMVPGKIDGPFTKQATPLPLSMILSEK